MLSNNAENKLTKAEGGNIWVPGIRHVTYSFSTFCVEAIFSLVIAAAAVAVIAFGLPMLIK